jgi:hypothetical protein
MEGVFFLRILLRQGKFLLLRITRKAKRNTYFPSTRHIVNEDKNKEGWQNAKHKQGG